MSRYFLSLFFTFVLSIPCCFAQNNFKYVSNDDSVLMGRLGYNHFVNKVGISSDTFIFVGPQVSFRNGIAFFIDVGIGTFEEPESELSRSISDFDIGCRYSLSKGQIQPYVETAFGFIGEKDSSDECSYSCSAGLGTMIFFSKTRAIDVKYDYRFFAGGLGVNHGGLNDLKCQTGVLSIGYVFTPKWQL